MSGAGALWSDARYAVRALIARPALTAVAVATLAIGSGAATTTFAVVDSILLEPLAYPGADEVVAIWHDAPGAEFPLEDGGLLASASMLATYAEQNRVFESIGLWTPGVATVTGDGEPEEVPRIGVTTGVLEALGVQPLLGRWFVADDLQGDPQVILSHGYWQRRFGGDPNVVARTMTVNSRAVEIIGVMPAGFRIADTEADLLMGPMFFDRANLVSNLFAYLGVARLKPGMTVADANADMVVARDPDHRATMAPSRNADKSGLLTRTLKEVHKSITRAGDACPTTITPRRRRLRGRGPSCQLHARRR